MDFIWDTAADALTDSLRMLPFLFLAYLLIEWIERRHGAAIERILAGGGKWGFVPGALLGVVPQCGFSAVAANLYASRVITLGTVTAVFLSTSDEAIPLMASSPECWSFLPVLIAIKVVYAAFAGFVLDTAGRKILPASLIGGYSGSAGDVDCHEEHEGEEEGSILLSALRHTLEIFLFLLVFGFAIGLVVGCVGYDRFAVLLGGLGFGQPIVAALVGLIPNCAASVLLTRLYLAGALRFSGLVAGLCAGAGTGLAVLWRANPGRRQNLFITLLVWAAGAAAGILIQIIMLFVR